MRYRGTTPLLLLKVWRDALALGSTSFSLIILVAIGCALFVLFGQARLNLEASYHSFYERGRFADGTVLVEEAPESLVSTIGLIPGVKQTMGRVVKDGTIVLRDRTRRRVTGRFIGVPEVGRPEINDVLLVEGRYLSNKNECLLEQQFAGANEVGVGEILKASYLGRTHDFVVVGLASSPEYLYPAPSKEAAFASPQTFGVVWLQADALRQWIGLNRIVTEVHVMCEPGTVDRTLTVMKALGERYGLRSWWDQAEQPSNKLLSFDLTGFEAMSIVFPLLFMFAATLSLYSSLTRIVRLQTGIVGFLRASGFGPADVAWHYISQGALITGLGAIPGVLLGHWGSVEMVKLYAGVLHLPSTVNILRPSLVLGGILLAAIAGLLSAWLPARAAAATPPAVAMRGDTRDEGDPAKFSWLVALTRRLPVMMRISARGLVRRPSRTLFAVGGLTCGAGLLLTTFGMYASIMVAMDEYIYGTLQYELDVQFIGPQGQQLANSVGALPGVTGVVKNCLTTVRLESSVGGTATLNLIGYQRGQKLLRIAQTGPQPDLRPGYLWVTKQTAKRLRVEAGDPVRVVWAYSSRDRTIDTTMRIAGILNLTFGGFAYGNYEDLRARLVDRIYPLGSYGAMIRCSREVGQQLRFRLERDELVAGVMSIGDIKDEVEKSLGITIVFVTILVSFGCVLSGAVLQSVSSISILERLRELATMRSLGFTAQATTLTAAVEVYFMALLGLAAGLPLGVWMLTAYMGLFETDIMSFPACLPPWCYAAVVVMVFGLVTWSLRSGVERLRTMDLAQATKARE